MMFSHRTVATALGMALAALLAACTTPVPLKEKVAPPVETRTSGATPAGDTAAAANTKPSTPAATQPGAQSRVATVDLAGNNNARANAQGAAGANAAAGAAAIAATVAAPRVVYFDYDSFVIKDEYKPVIESNAKQLVAARAKRVTIEGHTDERGGREYNLALGQKRAEAVARAMALAGAGGGQVEAVSFGKERPMVSGADEAAWAKNRRAELKDR